MTNVIKVEAGINGGNSKILVPLSNFEAFDIGKDGHIRMVYSGGQKTFPIINLSGPKDIVDLYEAALLPF